MLKESVVQAGGEFLLTFWSENETAPRVSRGLDAERGLRHPFEHQKRRTGMSDPHGLCLRSLRPSRQILFLLRSEAVDLDAHGFELQLSHALIELFRDAIDALLESRVVLDHVFDRQRLVGE